MRAAPWPADAVAVAYSPARLAVVNVDGVADLPSFYLIFLPMILEVILAALLATSSSSSLANFQGPELALSLVGPLHQWIVYQRPPRPRPLHRGRS